MIEKQLSFDDRIDVVEKGTPFYTGLYQSLNSPFQNQQSGLGSGNDKLTGTLINRPVHLYANTLEALYRQSWAVAKMVDIPVDDTMIRWRVFEGDSQFNEQMKEADRKLGIKQVVNKGLKASRLFGTSFIVIKTDDDPMNEPLNLSREINLLKFFVVNRYDVTVVNRDPDPVPNLR